MARSWVWTAVLSMLGILVAVRPYAILPPKGCDPATNIRKSPSIRFHEQGLLLCIGKLEPHFSDISCQPLLDFKGHNQFGGTLRSSLGRMTTFFPVLGSWRAEEYIWIIMSLMGACLLPFSTFSTVMITTKSLQLLFQRCFAW